MFGGSRSTGVQLPELRVDPQDNSARTFAECVALFKNEYTQAEIADYWNREMLPFEGEGVHNVNNDPFLTDMSRMQRTGVETQLPETQLPAKGPRDSEASSGPGQPRGTFTEAGRRPEAQPMVSPVEAGMADVKGDPFLTAGGIHDLVNVREDPFMQRMAMQGREARPGLSAESYASRGQFGQKVSKVQQDWVELVCRVIGEGYVERDRNALNMLVLLPWLLFCWTLVLGLVLRHYSTAATFGLMGFCALGSAAMLLLWAQGQRRGPISLLTMGMLCLIAVSTGALISLWGWDHYWRQFWWTQTGWRSDATSALTPAAARADYTVLNFWNKNISSTFNESRVDHMKSAGYKDTDYFCVAPILAPASAGATIVRVNYWAVGINCCQRYGGFTCDGARQYDAGTAMVMLNGGLPCPSCNNAKFQKAVAKAEAVHGLVSVEGAVFVRWVNKSTHLETWMTVWAIGYLLLCALGALLFFYVFGGTAWYYGVGIQTRGDSSLVPGLTGKYSPGAERLPDFSQGGA